MLRRLLVLRVMLSRLLLGCVGLSFGFHARPVAAQTSAELAASVLVQRGARYEQQGRRAAALRAYTDAVQLAPTSEQALLALAETRFSIGDYREAEGLFERLMLQKSTQPLVLRRMALLAERRGDGQQAERYRAQLCWTRRLTLREPSEQRGDCQQLALTYQRGALYVAALQVWRFMLGAALVERHDAEIQVQSLSLLSAELDPVNAGREEKNWVRRQLYHLSQRAPLSLAR